MSRILLLVALLCSCCLVPAQAQSPLVKAAASAEKATDAESAADAAPKKEEEADKKTKESSEPSVSERVGSELMAALEENMGGVWQYRILGLAAWRYLLSLLLLLATFLLSRFSGYMLRKHLARFAKLTKTEADDLVFTSAIQPAALLIQSFGMYLAVMALLFGVLPEGPTMWLSRTAQALAAGAVFWYLYRLIDVLDRSLRRLASRSDNDLDNAIVEVIRKSLKVFVFAIGAITIGKYIMGWKINALVAGAGIAGLAVAFAAQDTIANLFGTFMLLLDRPFRVGERVVIGGVDGPVESIGFRSTRIRTMDGNLVSMPNKTTADSVVENIGRRPHIKWPFVVGLVYDTPYEKMRKAVEILRDILRDREGMDPEFPPRVFFTEFADYSLNISVTVWYHGVKEPVDWWEYHEWREKINFEIMERFEAEGLEFAFPTQTMYLAHDGNRPLTVRTNQTGKTE